jgi:hypothetical protein
MKRLFPTGRAELTAVMLGVKEFNDLDFPISKTSIERVNELTMG